MTDGRFELWYGLIIMGLGIPVFIHYALAFIRESWHDWRVDSSEWLLFAKANYKKDIAETRRLLHGRRP
jgi:hypothetical protein